MTRTRKRTWKRSRGFIWRISFPFQVPITDPLRKIFELWYLNELNWLDLKTTSYLLKWSGLFSGEASLVFPHITESEWWQLVTGELQWPAARNQNNFWMKEPLIEKNLQLKPRALSMVLFLLLIQSFTFLFTVTGRTSLNMYQQVALLFTLSL